MTVIYCDLCGRSLERGDTGSRVAISEYKADSCDDCAKRLIGCLKSTPWKFNRMAPLIPSLVDKAKIAEVTDATQG